MSDDDPAAAARILLDECSLVISCPVWWGELDAFQHVNNTEYFRFFEHARIAYFDRIGWGEIMANERIGPILAHTDCRFRIPLDYPDTVEIGTRAVDLNEGGFVMEYKVASHRHGKLAAEGSGRIVSFDYRTNSKAPIPEPVRAAIEKLEGAVRG